MRIGIKTWWLLSLAILSWTARLFGQPSALDTSFNPGTGIDIGAAVNSMFLQSNGQIVIGGSFFSFNGISSSNIVRLNPDGSVDRNFNPGAGTDSQVWTVGVQETSTTVDSTNWWAYVSSPDTNAWISRSNLWYQDGMVLIGGAFTSVNNVFQANLARLHSDGSLDSGFTNQVDGAVESIVTEIGGGFYILGTFTSINGIPCYRMAHINTDGTLNTNFNPAIPQNGAVGLIALQTNGLLVSGSFGTIGNQAHQYIARLNTNGALDTNFVGPSSFPTGTGGINAIAVQRDNKVVVGLAFPQGGMPGNGTVMRLNSDGTQEGSFTILPATNGFINSIAVEADQKILVMGEQLERLNSDGSLDASFTPPSHDGIIAVAAQPDGKILIGGTFYHIDGTFIHGIARLNGSAPQLTITLSGTNIVLSWPTNTTGLTLESTTNLAFPVYWSPVSSIPVIINGQNTITNPISGGQQFYELVR